MKFIARLGRILAAAALVASSLVVAAPSQALASTPYGCWGQTISIWTSGSGPEQDAVYDTQGSPTQVSYYAHSYKITVNWCRNSTGTYSNGAPVYTLVSGWGFTSAITMTAVNHGVSPNRYVIYTVSRHTGSLYGPLHVNWCQFAETAVVKVNPDGSGSLTSSYLWIYAARDATMCGLGDLSWSGTPF